MFEEYNFNLTLGDRDINRPKALRIGLVQDDANAYKFIVKITESSGYLDDISWVDKARIIFLKADGNVVDAWMDVSQKGSNIITHELGTQEVAYPGTVEGVIQLMNQAETVVKTTERFSFKVIDSIDNTNAVQSSTELSALLAAIGDQNTNTTDNVLFDTVQVAPVPATYQGNVGEFYYDTHHETISFLTSLGSEVPIGSVLQHPGYNKTGVSAVKGDVVFLSGSQGHTPTFGFADAADPNKALMTGVVGTPSANNALSMVVVFGLLHDLDTSMWNVGDKLYLTDDGTGKLKTLAPPYPANAIWVATVMESHPTTGTIFVWPQLDHSVHITVPEIHVGSEFYYKDNLMPVTWKASTQPISPIEGDWWYNTTTKQLKNWNGIAWIDITSYTHDQAIAAAVWNIVHNGGKYPSVTIVDSSGNVVVGETKYISENEIQITFSSGFAGKAYLN